MSTRLQIMGSRIRTARQFRRLTGEQLAEKIGIAVDSLRHIENGVRSPSFQLIERISDILDVSLDYLAGKTDSPLEHRVRKELENSGLTKEQEDAIDELALNSITIIKKHIGAMHLSIWQVQFYFSFSLNPTVFALSLM